MAKTSKSIFQKETPSISRSAIEETVSRTAVEEPVPEPPLKMFIPGGCPINIDFKVEKPSSVPGRCEEVSRYIYSITEDILSEVKRDCNWIDKHVVIPKPDEAITTHVEGFLSVYTYPFTLGPLDPVIINFCRRYEVTLGQIHPSF